MPNPTIGVVITGRSDVSTVLATTDKQMQAFRRSVETNSRQIQKMTQTSGLGVLTKGFKGATDQSFLFYQNVSRTADSLGVLTGASSIAGVLALSKSLSGLGQSQLNASRGVNMGAQTLVAWQNVAKAAGSSADSATSSIAGMEKAVFRMMKMGDSHKGYADQVLGQGWAERYKTDTDKFLAISGYISGLHGDAKAEAMEQAEQTFGITPDFMQSVLASGPGYVQQQLKKGMASAPNAGQLGSLGDLATSFGDLENSITGAAEAGAASIAPKLIPALDTMSDWIDHHQKTFDAFAATLGVIGTGLGYKAVKGLLGGKGGGVPAPEEPPISTTSSSIWERLLPLGAGATDLALGALTGAGIALWPETPGKDSLNLSRGQMQTMAPNAAVIAATMRAQGAPTSFISAALGNFAWETGGTMDPQQQQAGGGPGLGIAMWEPPRQALLKQVEGVDIHQSTIQQQADFFLREMQHNYPQDYALLMSGKLDVQQATKLMMRDYEAPKDKDDPTGSIVHRTAYAQQWASVLDRASPDNAADDQALHNKAAVVSAADPADDPHVTVDVNIKHDGRVLTRQRQSSPAVTARVKTVTAMPTAGGVY